MLRERGASSVKSTARAVLEYADRVVVSDGASFDLDPAELAVRDGAWQLLDASAVILAGGASSRMGRDKSLLEIRGVPLIQRLIAQLRGRFREVLISSDDPAPYHATGLRVIPDRPAGAGPPGGHRGRPARRLETDTVFVVACDIPDIDPRFLRSLLAEARQADCAVPRRADGKWEPLFSAWRRSALPAIREVLAEGGRKIDAVFPRIRTTAVDLVDGAWLRNLNTPQDVADYLAQQRKVPRNGKVPRRRAKDSLQEPAGGLPFHPAGRELERRDLGVGIQLVPRQPVDGRLGEVKGHEQLPLRHLPADAQRRLDAAPA